MDRASVVVIGVGNSALSDEGVGGRVISELARRAPSGIELVDAGLPGPGLVELLEGRSKAVIVDAVDAGAPGGEIFRFRPEQVRQFEQTPRYSLHEPNVLQYVMLAQALEAGPKEVVFIGVQPESLSPGEGLSPSVEAAVPKAAALALTEALHQISPSYQQ